MKNVFIKHIRYLSIIPRGIIIFGTVSAVALCYLFGRTNRATGIGIIGSNLITGWDSLKKWIIKIGPSFNLNQKKAKVTSEKKNLHFLRTLLDGMAKTESASDELEKIIKPVRKCLICMMHILAEKENLILKSVKELEKNDNSFSKKTLTKDERN